VSTGFTFKVQLKSSRSTDYSVGETFVSESLDVDSAKYQAVELSTPVALVHADVERGVVYWTTPQLDTALNAKLTTLTTDTVTVRIPTANRLPETMQAFVQALARCALFLSTKWIANTPVTDFLAGMTSGPQAEERRAAFVRQAEMLKLSEAHRLFIARRIDEALAVVNAIAGDPSATIEARFQSELLAKVDALGPIPDRPKTIDEEFEIQRQIYRNMAESVGIDLEDATDPTAASIRIGLMDLNPSRVLRQCEHIFLKVGPAGLVPQWLKMPTAGTKFVHCTKHGYTLAAADLDGGYAALKSRYCDSCPDGSPRPAMWKYSYQWQDEQNKAFQAKATRLFEGTAVEQRNRMDRDPDSRRQHPPGA
jgi:hypothetical protein